MKNNTGLRNEKKRVKVVNNTSVNLIKSVFQVRSLCITQDSCRIVMGCSDKKVYIYDIHSAKLIKTLSGQNGEVTSVRITDKDDFLLTAGNKD